MLYPEELGQPGDRIGERYEVVREIGHGGNGRVFLVRDLVLDNIEVALKLLSAGVAGDPNRLARFRNEVVYSRRLGHPNIVQSYDFGLQKDGTYFTTMEYVDGCDLYDYIDTFPSGRLPFAGLIKILFELSLALQYAHEMGIIHRDVKPDNILISKNEVLKLSDFGTADYIKTPRGLTKVGCAIGTPFYMAPEQLDGRALDERVDVFAFGITAYELAAEIQGFEKITLSQMREAVLIDPEISRTKELPGVPSWFNELIARCVVPDPEQRCSSMNEVANVLKEHLKEGPESDAGLCPVQCPFRLAAADAAN